MLFIDGISGGIECTNVGFYIQDYESAFDLLSGLVADNWILQHAVIIDKSDSLEVPVEAFDGQPIGIHIRALQQDWKRILSDKPERSDPFSDPRLKNHFLRMDDYYDGLLKHLEKTICLLEISKHRMVRKQNMSFNGRLLDQCTLLLERNRKMYQHTREDRQRNLLRIVALETQH